MLKLNVHIQFQQTINLLALLCLAKYSANIYLPWYRVFSVLLFTLFLEHLFIYLFQKKLDFFSFSSLTTAIGVMLMMASPQLWIYMLVIGGGLLQKYLLQVDKKHFFNPSNFALLSGLFFYYDDTHIVLGQLGDDLWLNSVVMILAAMILVRVNRWIIPLVFVVSYIFLQSLLVVQYDPVMILEEVLNRFYSVSFIVFIVFMLTDPRTTPSIASQQFVFACLLALIAVLLDRYQGFRVQHLFMALFLLSPFIPLLTTWQESKERKKLFLVTTILITLVLGVTIQIESKAPYYFAMDN